MSRCFSVIGDSNVGRHLNKINCRSNPLMKSAQLLPCGHIEVLAEALGQLRAESNVCVLSCITNFFTSLKDASLSPVSHRVEPILTEFCGVVFKACEELPDVSFLVSPPMYRTHPTWYRDGLAEIMTMFSSSLGKDRPPNLHLLPSFPTPSFESDGVHLTAYSGLEFVLHLFDSSQELLDDQALSSDEVTHKTRESNRTLEDRMMVIEQDHRRLVRSFESKTASDAELHDWRMNERWEDFFVIKGLALLPSTGLSTKEWQERAIRDVQQVLSVVLGREGQVVFVQNATNKLRDTTATYHVQMASVSASKEIRDRFSGYFKNGKKSLPPSLSKISIRNRVTQETHIRYSIFHLFGQRYTKANQGSSYKVIGYLPRPVLKIFPSATATDRRIQTYTFMEAIRVLPTNFSEPELEDLIERIPPKFIGKLRSLFVVLPDDLARLRKKAQGRSASGATGATGASGATPSGASASSDTADEAEVATGGRVAVSVPEFVPHSSRSDRKRPPSSTASNKSKKGK